MKSRLVALVCAVLLAAAACSDNVSSSGPIPVDELDTGVDLDWGDEGTELTASICWQRTDDATTGECPLSLTRTGVSSPLEVSLADFACPKCGDVATGSFASYLNSAVTDGENTKLVEWRLDWTAGGTSNSRPLASSAAVASPPDDNNPFS